MKMCVDGTWNKDLREFSNLCVKHQNLLAFHYFAPWYVKCYELVNHAPYLAQNLSCVGLECFPIVLELIYEILARNSAEIRVLVRNQKPQSIGRSIGGFSIDQPIDREVRTVNSRRLDRSANRSSKFCREQKALGSITGSIGQSGSISRSIQNIARALQRAGSITGSIQPKPSIQQPAEAITGSIQPFQSICGAIGRSDNSWKTFISVP